MDPKPISILVTALFIFILGTYVFAKNSKKIINISFLGLAYSCGLWALALFTISIETRYEVLKFAGHMAFATGALLTCNFLLFAYVFPDKRDEFPPLRTLLIICAPGALMALLSFTPFIMKDIAYEGEKVRPVYGAGIYILMLYHVACAFIGFFLLARKFLKTKVRFERVQLKYTFWGTLLSAIGIVTFALLLPIAGVSQYSGPLSAVFIVIASASLSYAIVRHRLMDLGVVFRNVLIYIGTVAALGAVMGLVTLFTPVLRLQLEAVAFLSVLAASLLVYPVRNGIETLVDRFFFHGRYNYQAALTEFSHSMTKILDLEDLQNRIVHEVASILQVKSATILLHETGEKKYTVRAAIPIELADAHHEIGADSLIIRQMMQDHTLLVKEEMKRSLPVSRFQPIESEFDQIHAEVIIPLFYREDLLGLLTLGEKISSDIYSVEDINLLVTLGNQAAVALENALLHHTVIMLKNHNDNILKYMSSGVVAIDKNRMINTCNDKAREILRLPQDGVIHGKIDLLPSPLREMLSDTLAGKNRYSNQEVQILSPKGSICYLSASTSLIKEEKGVVTGALLVVNDLTEIRILEGEMWRADKLASLGTLAAGMAHEIKNPLVSIKTFAQLLPTRFEDTEFREKFSSITVDEVERINSLVEKLLEFARPTAPLFETADIIDLIEEVLLLLSNETSKVGVTVVRNFDVDSAPIVCDKSQFKQALLNLCLNALQAIEASRNNSHKELRVSVSLRKSRYSGGTSRDQVSEMFYGLDIPATIDDAQTVVIKVRDSGQGISRKNLGRIFDPFFTTKEKGLGLGLAVVHGIIKEHSGSITVDSKENVGTEFTISLPVTQIFAKERA
ncbi:MAG: PAS domain-containing protein [Candidatus Abyssobacteria bacterium SURF_5]|uniref:histidine kinase n=1 Tax=Abyssobacteria bacterium (strain SURF_5) TaxID=2093360 RepID=A0A3A4MUP8_ABYX5|nr:MAG: PAS domain-containing protein [Candidatus Abyssubacteria bacterium SURF_5]